MTSRGTAAGRRSEGSMQVALLLFDQVTPLDAVGPIEVLGRIPGAKLRTVAKRAGPITTEVGLRFVALESLRDVMTPEIVVIPGGLGSRAASRDSEILDWIRAVHHASDWTTSVCTGALILGAAGVLRGLRATTHWTDVDRLSEFGAIPSHDRVVRDGKVVTAAGVSAGIDMALRLAQLVAGDTVAQAIQLSMQYQPEPPFDTGTPSKAGAALVERVRAATDRALARLGAG
jgi:transcriptional regulator GlxA family with amidase domain